MNYIPQTNKWELYPPVQSACTFVAIDVFIKFNHLLYYPLFLTLTPLLPESALAVNKHTRSNTLSLCKNQQQNNKCFTFYYKVYMICYILFTRTYIYTLF